MLISLHPGLDKFPTPLMLPLQHIISMYVERFLYLLFSKTRQVSCKKQHLLTFPEHLRSPQFFRGPCFSLVFIFFYVQCLFLSFCVLLVPGFVFVHGFPFVLNCTSVVFPLLFSRLDFDEFVFYLSCLASLVFNIKILFCSSVFIFFVFLFSNLFNFSIVFF